MVHPKPSICPEPIPRVLVTAGPTHEPIDAVRYIGNRSSGRTGVALVQAALSRDWPVTLLQGPTSIDPPQHSRLTVKRFQTTASLQALLESLWPEHDLLLMAAAVADYSVVRIASRCPDEPAPKIKRGQDHLMLELKPTPDLLAALAPLTRPWQTVVGFALEAPEALASEAARKLSAKSLDAIVANPLATMDASDITATLLLRDGRSRPAPAALSKAAFADWLLEQLAPLVFSRLEHSRG